MATSGSYLTSQVVNPYTGDGCPDRANISWSAEWNPSTLQWTVNWSANGAGWTNNYYVTIFSGTVTITDAGGNVLQTKSMSGQIAQARKDVQLVSGSFNVGIDTLGNSSINFSATFRIGVNGPSGESTGSQSFALDAKPQGSIISSFTSPVSVGSSGGACAVSITRYSSSYTHDVTWAFGSYSYTATGVGTSTSYTIPASWLNAIPNAANGTGTITVVTRSGGTQVGNAATAQFTVSANVSPTIGSVTVAPRGTAYSAGITTVYIAGYSTALITASSVSGVQGSTISKVEFLRDGTVISSNTTRIYSYTTGTLNGSSATFSVRVTDSRGKQATASASAITIKAYATPSFSAASAYRCDSSGTASNDGTYVKVEATAIATPSENSIVSLTFAEKPTTSSTWSSEYAVANYPITSGYANTSSYDVRIKATDKLGQTSYKYFTIPTAEYTMDFKVGGKGVAFGKVAETDNLVDSAWAIKSSAAGTAYLAEHGLANNAAEIKIRRSDTNRSIALQVGSGGVNRGLYINDGNANQWLLYYNDSQVYINKPLNPSCLAVSLNTTLTNIILLKRLNIININIRGASINSSGSIGTIPSDYRPVNYLYFAGTYQSGSTTYPARILLDSNGDTQVKYFNGSNYVTATSGSVIANLTYFGVY